MHCCNKLQHIQTTRTGLTSLPHILETLMSVGKFLKFQKLQFKCLNRSHFSTLVKHATARITSTVAKPRKWKALNSWQPAWNGANCCSKANHRPACCCPTFNFHTFNNYLRELLTLLERQASVLLYT